MGGNRSGKTEILSYELGCQLQSSHPTRPLSFRRGGWRIWICSQNKDVQRDTIQDKIFKFIPDRLVKRDKNNRPIIYTSRGIISHFELEDLENKNNPINNTRITFKTYDSGVQSFESASVDLVLCDEEPPEDIFTAIMLRLLDRKKHGNGYFMCAMTPTNGLTWTFDRIIMGEQENQDALIVRMNMMENAENLGTEEIHKVMEKLTPEERRSRIEGFHTAREGAVLKHFSDDFYPRGNKLEYHDILPCLTLKTDKRKFNFNDWTPWESIDYGYRNPTAVGFYAVNREGEIVKFDEIYIALQLVPVIKGLIRWKRNFYGYERPYLTFIDPSTKRTESDGLTVFQKYALPTSNRDNKPDVPVFKTNPFLNGFDDSNIIKHISYQVPVIGAKNDRDDGWENFNEYLRFDPVLKRPRMFYTDNCRNSIIEAKNLTWPKETDQGKAKEISKKKRDHTCDENRYLLNAQPHFVPGFGQLIEKEAEVYYDSTTGY